MGNAYFKLKKYTKPIAIQPTGKWADRVRKTIREIENRDKP